MRISTIACAFVACFLLGGVAYAAAEPQQEQLTPQQQAVLDKIRRIAAGLHPQFGDVPVPRAGVTLHLGKEYYFLPADQARTVLVDAWGNTPDAAIGVQGMIFPAGKTFYDDSWGAVLTYEDTGYVSDSDAKTTNYDDLLKQAHDGENDENAARNEKGYEPLHLVGWAQPPYYDAKHHTLVWARDLKLGNAPEDSLNYDLRALGRRGVFSMNIIAGMTKLAEVRGAAAGLQNIATFDKGARYEDYQSGSDKVAEYGVGGLVAAGIGVLAVKKLGLLAVGLVFVKKFFAIILAAFAGAGAWFRRLFRGKKAEEAMAAPGPSTLPPPTEPPAA